MQRSIMRSSSSMGLRPLGTTRTAVTSVRASTLYRDQPGTGAILATGEARRGYAKPGKGGPAIERPKREFKPGDEYLDELMRCYGLQVPTWDDIPDWVWQTEVELQKRGKEPLHPLSGPLFWKKLNRENIKTFNEDRTWGVIKGKWKVGE